MQSIHSHKVRLFSKSVSSSTHILWSPGKSKHDCGDSLIATLRHYHSNPTWKLYLVSVDLLMNTATSSDGDCGSERRTKASLILTELTNFVRIRFRSLTYWRRLPNAYVLYLFRFKTSKLSNAVSPSVTMENAELRNRMEHGDTSFERKL